MSSITDKLNKLRQIKDDFKQVLQNNNVEPTDDFTTYPSVFDKVIEDSKSGAVYGYPEYWNIRTIGSNSGYALFAYVITDNINLNEYTDNISHFTSVERMFFNAEVKTLTMQNVDFSKVTTMAYMLNYYGAYLGDVIVDLSGIKTSSKLTNMNSLCYFSKIKTLNITGIDTSYVSNMNYLFNYSSKLEEVIGEIDCSRVTNGLYPSSLYNPFGKCTSLKRLHLKNIYKNCTLTNASKWSINLADTILENDCLISIMNELPTLPTGYTNIVLTLPPTNTLTDEQKQIAINKNWTVAN